MSQPGTELAERACPGEKVHGTVHQDGHKTSLAWTHRPALECFPSRLDVSTRVWTKPENTHNFSIIQTFYDCFPRETAPFTG